MSGVYRIYGADVSPYSVKVRSYFRYKGIPHEWIERNVDTQAEFEKYARLPLIPLVVTPDGEGLQDSTPILEKLETAFPEPSIHPGDPAVAFLSALLEEFADEWGNKWMFHYRWAREADRRSAGERIARSLQPSAPRDELEQTTDRIIERMVGRVGFVGSSEQTAAQIEASYRASVDRLETHLAQRPFLFGARPAFADFGLWGQLYCAHTDPTAGGILRDRAPRVVEWIERMLEPRATGDFEGWESLRSGLEPFLAEQVGGLFLPWSDANARAIAAGGEEFEVELAGQRWAQKPQKYHARSLGKLRARYAGVEEPELLDPILERAGCLPWLRA